MNMELDDLPPRYRAQAEQQLAARKRRAADPLAEAVKQAKAVGRDFDSRGEYEFYTGTVLPKIARGRDRGVWSSTPRSRCSRRVNTTP